MADESTKGKTQHVGGKVKEKTGELLGDTEMEREGRLEQAEGRARQDADRAEEELRRARARESAARRGKRK